MPDWGKFAGQIIDFVLDAIFTYVSTDSGDKQIHDMIATLESETPEQEQADFSSDEQTIQTTERLAQLAKQFIEGK